MGYVISWYGRVVDVHSWTFDEGSWHRSSRGDTAGCLMLVLFTNPSARAGYDTRSIFKQSLTGLNSEFSFS